MTKSQIELLMTRDVDDVSEVAVNHPPKQLNVTLKNAAALLAREERQSDIEERLFVFKLLRFVQAALAGERTRVTAEVARAVVASVQLVVKRNMAADLNRAARDVLSLLTAKVSTREVLMLALHQRVPSGEPFRQLKKVTLARQAQSAKSEATQTKGAPKPKGLPR
ncbi:MAG TPA: hypothetical protein VN380_08755 [Thermoanaerobaculia bacterium]|jgi:hypothetical protein|nr:hypothetical protein [Thermoanaerobaculia bacterium]